MLAPSTKHPDYNQRRRRPDSRQVLFSTCFMLAPSTKHPDYNQRRRPDSRQVLFSTCFMLAPSTKHPDSNQRRRPDSRQVLFSTCFMLAPSTKHPDYNQRRRPDSRQVLFSTCFMLANTQTIQPEETTRQQTSLVLHMLHVSTQHQTPRLYNQRRRRPDSRQVLFSTCFMLANTQTIQPEETTRQQTSLVLHMLHVGTQHQTPRLQPEEETTRQQTSLVLHMLHVGTKHPDPDSLDVVGMVFQTF